MVVWASRCKKTGVTLENLIFMAHLLDLTSTAEIPRCLDFYGSRHQLKMTPTNHGAMVKVSFPSDSLHKIVIRWLLVVGLIICVFFVRSPKQNSEGLIHQFRSFDLCFFGEGSFGRLITDMDLWVVGLKCFIIVTPMHWRNDPDLTTCAVFFETSLKTSENCQLNHPPKKGHLCFLKATRWHFSSFKCLPSLKLT